MGDCGGAELSDSLGRCPLSGYGYVFNDRYGQNSVSRRTHEFLHEILTVNHDNVRLVGLFCGYNNDKRAAKFIANRLSFEIYNESPIRPGTDPEIILDQLRSKYETAVKAYNEEMDELLTQRLLKKEEGSDEGDVELIEINAKLRAATTVLVVLFVDDKFYVLNCGNSRIILLTDDGEKIHAATLMQEHNNENEMECERLRELGIDPNTIMRPTRAIGDCFRGRCYIENDELSIASGPPVISTPDILAYKVENYFKSLILCSETITTAIEEMGVDKENVNKFLEDAVTRETAMGSTLSCSSIAQAVLDSLRRQHREQYMSHKAEGMYDRLGDLSLVLALFSDTSNSAPALYTDIQDSLSFEDQETGSPIAPITPYVDFDDFDSNPSKDEMMRQLQGIFQGDITIPFGRRSVELARQERHLISRGIRPSTSEPNLAQKKKQQPIVRRGKSPGTPKKLPGKTSKTLEDKRSSSSDKESDAEGTIKFLQPDLIQKLKKYDKTWFQPIRGYESACFGMGTRVFYSNADFLHYIDLDADNPRLDALPQSGEVTALVCSSDHSLIAVAVNEANVEGGASLLVLDSMSLDPLIDIAHAHKVNVMCISQGSEVLLALALSPDGVLKFTSVDLKSHEQSAVGEFTPNRPDGFWEVSFCPADEGIICCLGGGYAYLLRSLNGYIDKFSQILLRDVTCHSWASDVTLAFGTSQSSIHLYRETLALEIIDLSENYKSLLNREMPDCKVIAMSFTIRKYAVATQNGIILVFPMKEGSAAWNGAISIVLTECRIRYPGRQILSFDNSEENIMYSSGSQLLVSCLRHIKTMVKNGGRVVSVKHLHAINYVSVSDQLIATMDASGDIIVSSRSTNRVISFSRIPNCLSMFLGPQHNQLFVFTHHALSHAEIAFNAIMPCNDLITAQFEYCCVSNDRSLVSLFQDDRFDIYEVHNLRRKSGHAINLKKGVLKAVFSRDNATLTLLGQNDEIFSYDTRTGEVQWTVETKLQFYTDIVDLPSNIFVLNKRFGITRLRNGRDLGSMSMHCSTIGYQTTSYAITGTEDTVFLGTSCGQILVSKTAEIEEPFLFLDHCHRPLSFLMVQHEHLIVGSVNGIVVAVTLAESHSVPSSNDDLILWPYNRISNFTYLIQEIDLERNLIRKETDDFVKEYTERRDNEVEKMKEEYEKNFKSMKDRVKKIEESFEQSEQEKQITISNLKKLYEEEFRLQEAQQEEVVTEHIKSALRRAEQYQQELAQTKEDFKKEKEDMISSYSNTEQRLLHQKAKLEEELLKRTKQLEDEKRLVESTKEQMKELENEFACREENLNLKRKDEIRMLENELWNEKATSVQLSVQRDRAENESSKERTLLIVKDEKIAQLEADIHILEGKSQALMQELEACHKSEFHQRLANKKIGAALTNKTEEFETMRIKFQKVERKMKEVESKMDEISKCVYNSRALEHKVLGLLAYLNENK